jgi:transposase
MIPVPNGSHVWLATGWTGMRKGFDGLAALVQDHLRRDPFSGQAFVFRGRQGRLIKVLWWDGQGLCLFAKRLEKGRFVWPAASTGAAAALTPTQLAMLLEGIDWRAPIRTDRPQLAGKPHRCLNRFTRLP